MKRIKTVAVGICLLCCIVGQSVAYAAQKDTITHIIHYVWLGGKPLPDGAKKAIASWQKHLPEWKIMRWDESNCDLKRNRFIRVAIKRKQWAFASDICRLQALYEYGGLYMDTDQELHGSPEPLLKDAQVVLTYEANDSVSASFIATEKQAPFIQKMFEIYEEQFFTPTPMNIFIMDGLKEQFGFRPNGKWYISENLKMVPANYLMFDFCGGENIATHRYDSSALDEKAINWKQHFYNKFLEKNTLPVCLPNQEKILVIETTNGQGYVYKTNTHVSGIQKNADTLSINIDNKKYDLIHRDGCFREQ